MALAPALKVLLYADLRKHHARQWLAGLEDAGVQVRAVSSQIVDGESAPPYARDPVAQLRRALVSSGANQTVRRALAQRRRPGQTSKGQRSAPERSLQIMETLMTPLRLHAQRTLLRGEVSSFGPHLVHALRIPYEGLIALDPAAEVPVVVSSWGQDFILQAAQDPLLAAWMRRALPRASGLHVDSLSDLEHAYEFRLPRSSPVLHAAGNFGVDRQLFHSEPRRDLVVVYPRGRLRYVNHECFLAMAESAPRQPEVRFVGVGLTGDARAEALARDLEPGRLVLTPDLPREEFAQLMRSATVVTSPSTSDGTPNSVLEAMACGAHVMAGDIPSVRAVLSGYPDGALLDPSDPQRWVRHFNHWLARRQDVPSRKDEPWQLPEAFDREHNRRRVLHFYREVLDRSPA